MLENYKLSHYNFYLQKDNDLIVLNGISRSIVSFDNTNKFNLFNKIISLSPDKIRFLIEENFILAKNIDEYKMYLNDFYSIREKTNSFAITIGFTFRCNFNCIYCIQKGNHDYSTSLNSNQLDIIINWLKSAILQENANQVSINIFGGEPTLNLKGVYYFVKKFNHYCNIHNINVSYQMVTNGYALNESSINQLIKYNVSDFQITIDGLQEVHNKRRSPNFDSFSKIIKNIIMLTDNNAIVNLLHVYDTSNLEEVYNVINFFNKLSKKYSKLKENLCFNFAPTIPKNVKTVQCNKYVIGKEVFLFKEGVNAYKYASSLGFQYVNILDVKYCFRQAKNSILIAPDLKCYKCYSVFGKEQYSFGTLYNSFNDYLKISESFSKANGFTEKCRDCTVVPFCRGGCQFAASENNNGQYGHPYCEKDTIETFVYGFLENNLF